MLLAQQERYSDVMVFPEVTISSSWPKSDQFGHKSRRAGHVINKVLVTPYLAMAEPTRGSGHGTHWLLLGKRDLQSCCFYSKHVPWRTLSPEKQHTPGHLGEEGAAECSCSSQQRECVLSKQPRKQRGG